MLRLFVTTPTPDAESLYIVEVTMPVRKLTALVLATMATSTIACGFLEDNTDVTHRESIPVSFSVDADEICEQTGGLDNCGGESQPAPMRQELARIEQDIDVDVVERTGNENLDDLTGRFKEITITSIDYRVESNTLTFDLPEMDLYMGPKPATSRDDDGTFSLATLPTVDAGQDTDRSIDVSQGKQDRASDQLKTLKLSAIPSGRPVIEEGQQLPPSGNAEVTVVLNVKFVANPVDAAT